MATDDENIEPVPQTHGPESGIERQPKGNDFHETHEAAEEQLSHLADRAFDNAGSLSGLRASSSALAPQLELVDSAAMQKNGSSADAPAPADSTTNPPAPKDATTSPAAKTDTTTSPAATTDTTTNPAAATTDTTTNPAATTDTTTNPAATTDLTTNPAATTDAITSPAAATTDLTTNPAATTDATTNPAATTDLTTNPAATADLTTNPAATTDTTTNPAATTDGTTSPAALTNVTADPEALTDSISNTAAPTDGTTSPAPIMEGATAPVVQPDATGNAPTNPAVSPTINPESSDPVAPADNNISPEAYGSPSPVGSADSPATDGPWSAPDTDPEATDTTSTDDTNSDNGTDSDADSTTTDPSVTQGQDPTATPEQATEVIAAEIETAAAAESVAAAAECDIEAAAALAAEGDTQAAAAVIADAADLAQSAVIEGVSIPSTENVPSSTAVATTSEALSDVSTADAIESSTVQSSGGVRSPEADAHGSTPESGISPERHPDTNPHDQNSPPPSSRGSGSVDEVRHGDPEQGRHSSQAEASPLVSPPASETGTAEPPQRNLGRASGNAPGSNETPEGSGRVPGENSNPPGSNHAPEGTARVPGENSNAPGSNQAPGGTGRVPAENSNAPGSNQAPAGIARVPAENSNAPGSNQAPDGTARVPAENSNPPGSNQAADGTGRAPRANSNSPEGNHAPDVNGGHPPAENGNKAESPNGRPGNKPADKDDRREGNQTGGAPTAENGATPGRPGAKPDAKPESKPEAKADGTNHEQGHNSTSPVDKADESKNDQNHNRPGALPQPRTRTGGEEPASNLSGTKPDDKAPAPAPAPAPGTHTGQTPQEIEQKKKEENSGSPNPDHTQRLGPGPRTEQGTAGTTGTHPSAGPQEVPQDKPAQPNGVEPPRHGNSPEQRAERPATPAGDTPPLAAPHPQPVAPNENTNRNGGTPAGGPPPPQFTNAPQGDSGGGGVNKIISAAPHDPTPVPDVTNHTPLAIPGTNPAPIIQQMQEFARNPLPTPVAEQPKVVEANNPGVYLNSRTLQTPTDLAPPPMSAPPSTDHPRAFTPGDNPLTPPSTNPSPSINIDSPPRNHDLDRLLSPNRQRDDLQQWMYLVFPPSSHDNNTPAPAGDSPRPTAPAPTTTVAKFEMQAQSPQPDDSFKHHQHDLLSDSRVQNLVSLLSELKPMRMLDSGITNVQPTVTPSFSAAPSNPQPFSLSPVARQDQPLLPTLINKIADVAVDLRQNPDQGRVVFDPNNPVLSLARQQIMAEAISLKDLINTTRNISEPIRLSDLTGIIGLKVDPNAPRSLNDPLSIVRGVTGIDPQGRIDPLLVGKSLDGKIDPTLIGVKPGEIVPVGVRVDGKDPLDTLTGEKSLLGDRKDIIDKKDDKDKADEHKNDKDKDLISILAAAHKVKDKKPEVKEEEKPKDEKKDQQEVRRKYIVRQGDTLESIAEKIIGDKRYSLLLEMINRGYIRYRWEGAVKTALLRVGQVIWLPTTKEVQVHQALFFTRKDKQKSRLFDGAKVSGPAAEAGSSETEEISQELPDIEVVDGDTVIIAKQADETAAQVTSEDGTGTVVIGRQDNTQPAQVPAVDDSNTVVLAKQDGVRQAQVSSADGSGTVVLATPDGRPAAQVPSADGSDTVVLTTPDGRAAAQFPSADGARIVSIARSANNLNSAGSPDATIIPQRNSALPHFVSPQHAAVNQSKIRMSAPPPVSQGPVATNKTEQSWVEIQDLLNRMRIAAETGRMPAERSLSSGVNTVSSDLPLIGANESEKILKQLDSHNRIIMENTEREGTFFLRQEKQVMGEWKTIAYYEFSDGRSVRYLNKSNGARRAFHVNLPQAIVKEMAVKDFSNNWKTYARDYDLVDLRSPRRTSPHAC